MRARQHDHGGYMLGAASRKKTNDLRPPLGRRLLVNVLNAQASGDDRPGGTRARDQHVQPLRVEHVHLVPHFHAGQLGCHGRRAATDHDEVDQERSDLPHNDVVNKRQEFGEFLKTSCLGKTQ